MFPSASKKLLWQTQTHAYNQHHSPVKLNVLFISHVCSASYPSNLQKYIKTLIFAQIRKSIFFFFSSFVSSHWKFGFDSQATPCLHYSWFNFSNSALFWWRPLLLLLLLFFRIQLVGMCGGSIFLCTLIRHAEILKKVYWKRKILFPPLSRSFNRITKMTYFMNAQIIYIHKIYKYIYTFEMRTILNAFHSQSTAL